MGDSEDADKKNKAGGPRKRYEIPKTATCHVCGDKAAEHLHYGGIACYSCRAFFRRTVNNTRPVLDCSNSNNCKINKDTRKRCQACRFQKCKDIGMKPSWVLSELEKSRLQDCGRRTNKTPDSVLVKKEEEIDEHSGPHVKDERASSQGSASGGGEEDFTRGDDRAGPSHSGAGAASHRNLHSAAERKSPMPRIKVENPSTPTLDNPTHPLLDNPSQSHPHERRSNSAPGVNPWGGSDRQPSHASSSAQWDSKHTQSQFRPSSSNSLPQQRQRSNSNLAAEQRPHSSFAAEQRPHSNLAAEQRPHSNLAAEQRPHSNLAAEQRPHSSLAAEQQWSSFSRQTGAEMTAGRSEYDVNNMQKESLFPFNKMQVSLSAPGRDGLSFTIETHQTNDGGWRRSNMTRQPTQMGASTHSNTNQNTSYRQNPSSLFSGYNNDTTHHQNKFPSASSEQGGLGGSSGLGGPSGPGGSSGPSGQIGRQGSAPVQGSSQQQKQQQQAQACSQQPPSFNNELFRGSTGLIMPDSNSKSGQTSSEKSYSSSQEELFEEYMQGGGLTNQNSNRDSVQSVISRAQLPNCRDDGEQGTSRDILGDWESCGGPAKRIKTETPEQHRNILQMIDAVSRSHRATHSPIISPTHLNSTNSLQSPPYPNPVQSPPYPNPLQSPPYPNPLQSPTHSIPIQSPPQPQNSSDTSFSGEGGGYDPQRLFSPLGGAISCSSPGAVSSSSLMAVVPPVHVVSTPSHVALNHSLGDFSFQDEPNQDPHSSQDNKKNSLILKLGQFPMSSPMDYIQETIFLEQLASIDENLKSQVPMDEEHCRAFMLSALTGNKLRQYTILHAYQILIKRIVRLSNSIQDFIELPPGDMHKLLVANTVSMINVRIARWFHPKTSLEEQLSLCSARADLYKEVVLQKDLDPQFVERQIKCDDVFVTPWCCDYTFEDRYCFLLNKMAQLPLDSIPLILLSVVMLFNSERVSGLDQIKLIVSHERKFSFLLFRYLQNKYKVEQAQQYFQMFSESKNYLIEMADILINKRLIC